MARPGSLLRKELEDCWELDVPAFEYQPLNHDAQEQRFLVLHPCPGDKAAPSNHVRCSIETRPLAAAGSFIAVRDSRGYRHLQDAIEIDGKGLVVSAAAEVFLRHFRGRHLPITLWMRHICLVEFGAQEEQERYWNRNFIDSMYARATGVVSMSEIVTDLVERGIVETQFISKYSKWDKTWHYIGDEAPKLTLPTVYPIKLGGPLSNDAPVTKHNYVPLDMLVNEIRVLVVVPSEDDSAPVQAHLAHCPMVCEVAYQALSYTWGSPGTMVEMAVNGQKMLVRKNLEQALRTIRQSRAPTAIWVDAICIDQSNTAERNRQVPRMFGIYDRAFQVVCYVGGHDESTDQALDFVPNLDRPAIGMNADRQLVIGQEGNKIGPETYPKLCAALYKFLCRSYFKRIWIVQEVAISTEPLIVVDSGKAVSFGSLDAAAYNLQAMIAFNPVLRSQMAEADPELEPTDLSYERLIFVRKLFYFRHLMAGGAPMELFYRPAVRPGSPGFLEAAVLTRDFEATDERDKIFALWNLAQDKNGLEFSLDYGKSFEVVFLDFATAWARQHGSLDIIAVSEPHRSATFYERMPSWCPDWATSSSTSCMVRRERIPMRPMVRMDDLDGELYSADGGVAQLRDSNELFSFDGHVLQCRGVILDRIGEIIDSPGELPQNFRFLPPDPDTFHKIQEWPLAIHKIYENQEPSPYEDPLQAAVSMFHGDVPSAWKLRGVDPDKVDNMDNTSGDEKYKTAWHRYDCMTEKSRHIPKHRSLSIYEREPWLDVVHAVLRGRVLCITEKRYMALLPSHVAEDGSGKPWLLAILATCSVPVLLQEAEIVGGETTYRLGGACFVQGWMEGEMLERAGFTRSPAEFWFTKEGESNTLRII
ncbi:HET-domain-containing protein [Colletotrichum zoysiae]|uniref:HET-domain-containing protein n=1 Tax=Colletotrichum zoysiae TaxID=1216348 RepID=A0AAD9M1W4_9PEZI|nr:HET-domain-containing protein [Colletotrichum zoysiae]